jgi:ribonuclease P protein component
MIGRLVRSADFQRLLATPMRSRSAHFALHHVAARPSLPARVAVHPRSTDLSTDGAPLGDKAVDSLPQGHWLGSVIPKRHARRAVTRNLLRRQIRVAMAEQLADPETALPAGLWLVRLRAPFAREQFPSAASDALRLAARAELRQLFKRAAQPAPTA